MAKKELIAKGECYYGVIAFLEEKTLEHWTPIKEGGLKKLEFCKSGDKENIERRELTVSVGDISEKKEKEILDFFKSLKSNNLISLRTIENNSWERFIEEEKKQRKDFFVYAIEPEKTNKNVYGFSSYQGTYSIYKTKNGFECWYGDEPMPKKVVEKKKIKEIELEEEKFVFGVPNNLPYEISRPFTLEKGIYQVEVGYDNYNGPIVFKIKKNKK